VARKKITQKTRRKDELDPTKDQFVTKSISFLDWAIERRRQILVFFGAAIVFSVAGILINRWIESKRAEASALLGEALDAHLAPLVPPQEGEVPPPEDEGEEDELIYESAGARATESLTRFEAAIEDQGSSPVGLMALLGAAAAHLDLGENDKAIEKYERFLQEGATDAPWLEPNALEGLGHALERAGKLDEARARYKELADGSEGRTKLVARYDEARIAERQGDEDAAKKMLEEIVGEITEGGEYDRLDFLFIEAGERLKALDPDADVPSLPGGGFGGLEGLDPAMLQQLMQAQQAAGGGAIR
jgi:tetratricopeptide (TPR) repeat protein